MVLAHFELAPGDGPPGLDVLPAVGAFVAVEAPGAFPVWGYLEHLVVALYSHCWLMMILLATFLVSGLASAFASPSLAALSQWLYALLWFAIPVYLLWMQQRVYGGNKALTVLRYLAIGGIYLLLLSFVVMYAVLAGISA